MSTSLIDKERIAILETEMRVVLQNQAAFLKSWEEVNGKLDELLSLRNKGVGAFWLASILTGTGIIGALVAMLDWWKGLFSG